MESLINMKSVSNIYEQYTELIREMIRGDNKDLLQNSSIRQAKIIIQELIRYSKSSIHIVSSTLPGDFWDDEKTLAALNDAYISHPDLEVHIATKSPFPNAQKFAAFAKQHKAQLYNINNDTVPDFCLVDKRRFRIEPECRERDAQVCFNSEMVGETLYKLFNAQAKIVQ